MVDMRGTICDELRQLEHEHDTRVLLAVESGSRAWGMASEDSDYDVRCVYVRPLNDYLRLDKTRDTVEWRLDETLDINGWDLTKFLRLAHGSNPTAFEWLSSPIVYQESPEFARVRSVASTCFSPKAAAFHYLGMERGHDRRYISGDAVRSKKYLYIIRAVLAARWCLDELTPPPMLLADLLEAKLPVSLRSQVDNLLQAKLAGSERDIVPRNADIENWFELEDQELYQRARHMAAPEQQPWDELNTVFFDIIRGRAYYSGDSSN